MAVKAIPEGHHAITPYLVVHDAPAALDFYQRAFDAKELGRMNAPNGKVAHAEIKIGDSIVMLSDEMPEMGAQSPRTLKGSAVGLFIYTADVDSAFDRAVAAGATAKAPVTDMFWGDRWGLLEDPFGHQWQIATHKEDLSAEEIGKRAAKAMSAGA